MIIKIDFNSEEALYIQLVNSIIMGIAMEELHEGDSLPSVRQLAEEVGINMHTVNKAYGILRQDGYIKLDRRKGAVVAVDADHINALEDLSVSLQVVLAKALCRNVSPEEIHVIVDEVIEQFLNGRDGR